MCDERAAGAPFAHPGRAGALQAAAQQLEVALAPELGLELPESAGERACTPGGICVTCT